MRQQRPRRADAAQLGQWRWLEGCLGGSWLTLASSGGRIGEAANPGPLAKVLSANCTSLKGGWAKLLTTGADLLILQEVRCTAKELQAMAIKAKGQVVFGEDVQGTILVAAFAWNGTLQKISKCPTGQAHHFQWRIGCQSLRVRNGYFQGQNPAGP